jgi:hypothetical protein
MTTRDHLTHAEHPHHHDANCGHIAVKHGDHVDYLHDGHLHHPEGDDVEEHVIEVTPANPARCTPENGHKGHEASHVHGPGCGHEAVPHGDHIDYPVDSITTTATIATITVHSTSWVPVRCDVSDPAWAGQGMGMGLFNLALAQRIRCAAPIGGRVLIVNAVDVEAASFWRRLQARVLPAVEHVAHVPSSSTPMLLG